MFGYVRPFPDEMKGKDLRLWREDYCGLCRCLGKRHGLLSRFLLSYDMTFLYALLVMDRPVGEKKKCWCPAGVVCRKICRMPDAAMEYAADLTVLLSYRKFEDEIRDGDLLRRTGAKLLRMIFSRAYRRASQCRPDENAMICNQLARLSSLEHENCTSIDQTADAFATILSSFSVWWQDTAAKRAGEQLLYHVGRYVYLVDALDDLDDDRRSGSYNPILARFCPQGDAFSDADKAYLVAVLDASISQAAVAFELLPRGKHGAVVENILYYGLPGVLKAVSKGVFRRKKRMRLTKER